MSGAATVIDLSKLAAPTLIPVDYDADLALRLASFKARCEAEGIPYDVEMLETDPAVILQQEDASRQMLDKQAINDTALARTIAFGQRGDLDHTAVTFYADVPGIARLDGENDDRYRRRILLAGEALSGALTEGGIVYHAMSFDRRVIDAAAYRVAPGRVQCVILVERDAPAELLRSAVFSHLRQPKLRGTNALTVSLVEVRPRAVKLRLQHAASQNGAVPRQVAEAALAVVQARVERAIGAKLTTDELIATARVGGVVKLILEQPMADLDPGRNGVLSLDIEVTAERLP